MWRSASSRRAWRKPRSPHRVADMLAMVKLESFGRAQAASNCPAASASAWRWRARWSSARALLLLDEPLAALDKKLRDADAVRADGPAAQAWTDFRHRHPRPERSHDRRRPYRRDGQRLAPAGRLRPRTSTSGRIRAGLRTSSATSICSRVVVGEDGLSVEGTPAGTLAWSRRRSRPSRAHGCGWRCGRKDARPSTRRQPPPDNCAAGTIVDIGYLGELTIYKSASPTAPS